MPEGAGPATALTGARRSCDFSMAVFADLDLRAGSDLKALRGLVENAAHRESPRRGRRCLPSLAAPQTVGHNQEEPGACPRPGLLGSLGCPWKLMPPRCCSDPGRGKLEGTWELLSSLAPSLLHVEEH